ncbi:uncharacterized protein PHACADRAFT_250920 [Phanerochaete carnosa HHB-10118-sp]|uniref:Uncharacterized protein n=1 Tax=Phanerochaete carnosa (strain HHB-10118-sp) TaxID=650164 RepID=K5WLJ3_PHACS|nr:uncharacterized protein PHACADRAFT_250920 [Phanerochaete carnosa HHB-10118-sp]EKM60059.1 hypothetical protein PHACADRAFT_250920 [Phanerochaete carnosa HHB-10118-sp]
MLQDIDLALVPRSDADGTESDGSTATPTSPTSTTSSAARKRSSLDTASEPDSTSSHPDSQHEASSVVVPLVPWVTVLIRYLGRPVVVTCLARAYLATLTFSVRLMH